jgi:putative tricarboxylic transport membrane protein
MPNVNQLVDGKPTQATLRRKTSMFRKSTLKGLLLTAALGAAAISATALIPASAAENFYQGKTVTIIVPYGPGGGYDTWARLIAPYMQQYLGAAQVRIENKPGGGGLVGTNATYSAAPDGLTIGDTNAAGDVFAEMAKAAGVKFETAKFNWIGRPDEDPHVIAVHPNSPYKTFDDIAAAKGGKKVLRCLATGKGSSDYNSEVITMNAFEVPFQMVAAFKGSHEEKATFLSGGGDTIGVSASDIAQVGNKARVVLLTAVKPFDKLPGVPTVVEEAKKHKLPAKTVDGVTIMAQVMEMGHAFFAPPGVPADRLQALQSAFQKAFDNKEFVAKAEKAGLYVGYGPASDLQEAAQKAFQHTDELTPLLKS